MSKFDTCLHNREFHIDADKSWWPGMKPRQSFFICHTCRNVITLQEKCNLDMVIANDKSLIIQERQSKYSMRANIITAFSVVIALIALLFWDKIISCTQ